MLLKQYSFLFIFPQPLNDDKYLCFSCNNWLINWHSLQVGSNSNVGEQSSGSHYSSQVNSNKNRAQKRTSNQQRPVAVCRPMGLAESSDDTPTTSEVQRPPVSSQRTHARRRTICKYYSVLIASRIAANRLLQHARKNSAGNTNRSLRVNFNRRNLPLRLVGERPGEKLQTKYKRLCPCGRWFIVYINRLTHRNALKALKTKCMRCRELNNITDGLSTNSSQRLIIKKVNNWAVAKDQRRYRKRQLRRIINQRNNKHTKPKPTQQSLYKQPKFPAPLVDGKVVAMLRRLGTTLSAEATDQGANNQNDPASNTNGRRQLPKIMSPAKPKAKWTRPLDADEISVMFDNSIQEVLPQLLANRFSSDNSTSEPAIPDARRKLNYDN